MPLSEGEQRRLDEIERALQIEDPTFALTITVDRRHGRRSVMAGVAFALGMVVLVSGLVVTDAALWVGVGISLVGAAAMAAGAVLFFRGNPRFG